MQSDLILCNKHFNKDLIEAFKALKRFKYKQLNIYGLRPSATNVVISSNKVI